MNTTSTQAVSPCTPASHASTHKTKPVRLLELGTGPHGKTALLEFPEGWKRTIDLPTQADAWHPLFDGLPQDERSRLRAHMAHSVTRHPDGTRTKQGPLSFVTIEVNGRGNMTEERHFDVPAEDYGTGQVTGYRCAAELLDALKRGYGPHLPVCHIIHDAINALSGGHYLGASGKGAGVAFMSVIEEAVRFLANHSRHAEFIAHRIEEAERNNALCAERIAQEKAEFVERMRQSRAKKRAAKGKA